MNPLEADELGVTGPAGEVFAVPQGRDAHLGAEVEDREDMGGQGVAVTEVIHPVLRRRDLMGLFDTNP